jgi:hypothetical protein
VSIYALSDWSIQQVGVALAILPLLVALTWYVSHPAHRRRLYAAIPRPGVRDDLKLKRAA